MENISRRTALKYLLGSLALPVFGYAQEEIQEGKPRNFKKIILINRDSNPQALYAFEGENSCFEKRFGKFIVSMGMNKYGSTPLGYYHVRKKQECAVNEKHGWVMPHVQWYSPADCPEGINGIHEGEKGTKYGIPQSHGCTRMKKKDAEILFDWSRIGTPIVIIGRKDKNDNDRELFSVADYESFRKLIEFSDGKVDLEKLVSLKPFEEKILDACRNYKKIVLGNDFAEAVGRLW